MGAERLNRDLNIEELREIVAPIAKKYGAGNIYLFGSRVRGDHSENSDFDFYVNLGAIEGLKICGLLRELEEALESKVDIITDKARLSDDLSKEIFREMKTIYEG